MHSVGYIHPGESTALSLLETNKLKFYPPNSIVLWMILLFTKYLLTKAEVRTGKYLPTVFIQIE